MERMEPADEESSGVSARTLAILERLDNLAHVVVAALFILMALSVFLYTGSLFLRQMPLITAAYRPAETQASAARVHDSPVPQGEATGKAVDTQGIAKEPVEAASGRTNADTQFFANSLELLSSILFAVILLELLRTIITFLKTRDIQAIMQEFLVVGIISSVRKILLVGAQSSLEGASDQGLDFIKEASEVVISILGVLLLIIGLIALQRSYEKKSTKHSHIPPSHPS